MFVFLNNNNCFSKYCVLPPLHQPLYLRRPRPDRALGLGGGHLLLQPLEVLGLLRLLRLLLLVHLHAAELRPAHRALADYLKSRQ